MSRLALGLCAAVALATAVDAEERGEIRVVNEARVPAAELDSILADFRAWARRVYDYTDTRAPQPVTLELTRRVRFGFYGDGVVTLPPNADRWIMLEDWIHELAHHATGQNSSFFFKEGVAVHVLEALYAREGRVPQTWPQFGQRTDAWVARYRERGVLLPLKEALAWPHYRRDEDFESWQIYNLAGSFTGWYRETRGLAAWRRAFARERPDEHWALLQREWLAAVARRQPASFDPAAVLPAGRRYDEYRRRLTP